MSHRKKVTLHDLQSLIGLLNFACVVIAPGRAFLCRLIDLIVKVTAILCISSASHVKPEQTFNVGFSSFHILMASLFF